MKPLVYRLCFVLSALSFATHADGITSEKITVPAQNAELQGYRFRSPSREVDINKWVVFTHGLGSNLHEFESLIPEFVAAGYDCYAFNFRGHGNGAERSLVTDYREGDYRLEKMAEVDFPAIVAHIQSLHPGKGVVVGHSMGGMVPRGSFAQGLVSKDQVESMVLLGSPPHFETMKKDRQSLDLLGLLNITETFLNLGPGNQDVGWAALIDTLEIPLDLVNFYSLPYWLAKDFLKSINPAEWLARALSRKIPKDILRSFASYTRQDYPYAEVKIPVPILHIMGEKDRLARHGDIEEHTPLQSEDAGYWLVKMRGVDHLGLVTLKVVKAFRNVMFEFISKDGRLGASHKSYFEILSPSCEEKLRAPK